MNKSAVLAVCLCAAMVASGLFVAAPARAGDTSNTLVVDVRGAAKPPFITVFHDVAWTPDGKYAMFVGTDTVHACAWWYDPTKVGDGAWTQASLGAGLPVATVFYTVEWDADNGYMVMAGDYVGHHWYHAARGGLLYEETDLQLASYIEDLVYQSGKIWGVGRVGTTGHLYFQDTTTHVWAEPPASTTTNANWYCCGIYSGRLYAGGDNGAGGLLYGYYPIPNGPWTILFNNLQTLRFTGMTIDPTYSATPRLLMTASNRASSPYGIFSCVGADLHLLGGLVEMPITSQMTAIDVDSTGFAVAVGQNGSSLDGLVYDIWHNAGSTNTHYSKRSTSGGIYANKLFTGVKTRPTGVQMALITGSSYRYSYTSVLAPIQVDTAVPHIDYIDVYPTGTSPASSVLNTQTDVDIGDSNTRYTIEVRAYDNLGYARLTSLDVWMWYDDGFLTTDIPLAMGATFDNPGAENKRIHFTIDYTGAFSQLYPATGVNEETSLIGGTWAQQDVSTAIVRLNFSPHQQVRYAPSASGFGQPAGTRYGGGVSQGQSMLNALDAGNTWDIKVRVADDAPTTNYVSAFDEFGFYKYTYLSAANIPNGGAVYGSGAPGTNNVVMTQSGSDVIFSANCPYSLNVQLMSNLVGVAVPANTINANLISVNGGARGGRTPFIAGGSTINLIGPGPMQAPLDSYRITTSSSWDGNAGTSEPIEWWVDIPAVPEDSYVSQILWSISN